jgi:hypothetical protein
MTECLNLLEETLFSREEIVGNIQEFLDLYKLRPIKDNIGGMKAPHMFATWFMVKNLNPDIIVESGVWRGQSTWLLRQACPNAKIISIDLNLEAREYVDNAVTYSDKDFSEHDWSEITENSLVFFDDHQNAYKRLQQCKWFGFKHIIFEDNYPPSQGDCYSLKKAFANAGFDPINSMIVKKKKGFFQNKLQKLFGKIGITPITLTPQYESVKVLPNDHDAKMIQKNIEIYYEFPPVLKTEKTRWGDDWDDINYPSPEPLFKEPKLPEMQIFLDEAIYYTWICYVKLK